MMNLRFISVSAVYHSMFLRNAVQFLLCWSILLTSGWTAWNPVDMDSWLNGRSQERQVRPEDHDVHQSELPRPSQHTDWPDDTWPVACWTHEIRDSNYDTCPSAGHFWWTGQYWQRSLDRGIFNHRETGICIAATLVYLTACIYGFKFAITFSFHRFWRPFKTLWNSKIGTEVK